MYVPTPQFETPPFRGGLSQLMLGDGNGNFETIPASKSGLVVRGDGRGLVKTDLNADGHPDYVISINNGELLAFKRESDAKPPNQLILKVIQVTHWQLVSGLFLNLLA